MYKIEVLVTENLDRLSLSEAKKFLSPQINDRLIVKDQSLWIAQPLTDEDNKYFFSLGYAVAFTDYSEPTISLVDCNVETPPL